MGIICAVFLFIGFAAIFAGNPGDTASNTSASLQSYERKTSTGGTANGGSSSKSKSKTAQSASSSSKGSSSSSLYSSSYKSVTHSGTKTTVVASGKPAKALSISPSSITIYKNTNGAAGVKAGVTSTAIQVNSSDGEPINEPSLSGAGIAASNNGNTASRASWSMETSAGSASLGGYTVSLTASSPSGTVYTGSLYVNVAPVPAFSVGSSNLNAIVRIGTTNTANFTGLDYDASTSGGAAPTVSATNILGGDITCSSGLSYNASQVTCTDPNISKESSQTTIPMAFTFQNQYQLITVAGDLIFTNSSNF
jgi:hypothetical protein